MYVCVCVCVCKCMWRASPVFALLHLVSLNGRHVRWHLKDSYKRSLHLHTVSWLLHWAWITTLPVGSANTPTHTRQHEHACTDFVDEYFSTITIRQLNNKLIKNVILFSKCLWHENSIIRNYILPLKANCFSFKLEFLAILILASSNSFKYLFANEKYVFERLYS